MTMQNPASTSRHVIASGAEFSDAEEGARYALLQRLAPALQHHIMGKFQSMGMIAAMMERRLQSATPDLANIRQDCESLGSVSRTAVNSIVNIMTWIEPKTAFILNFDAGVKECVGLLSTEFRFKGFVISNEVPEIHTSVSGRGLRSVLSAALMALGDQSKVSGTLVIQAQAMPDRVELSIELRPKEQAARNVHVTDYRMLRWRDVETLAMAESVRLTHSSTGVQMVFNIGVGNAGEGLAG